MLNKDPYILHSLEIVLVALNVDLRNKWLANVLITTLGVKMYSYCGNF